MLSDKMTLMLSSVRNYEYLKSVVSQINENLYGSDLFENDRIKMDVELDEDGSPNRFIITGTALDFFQIGLRYGSLEEIDRAKKISSALNKYYY